MGDHASVWNSTVPPAIGPNSAKVVPVVGIVFTGVVVVPPDPVVSGNDVVLAHDPLPHHDPMAVMASPAKRAVNV